MCPLARSLSLCLNDQLMNYLIEDSPAAAERTPRRSGKEASRRARRSTAVPRKGLDTPAAPRSVRCGRGTRTAPVCVWCVCVCWMGNERMHKKAHPLSESR